jgi:hydrogenase maturation protease
VDFTSVEPILRALLYEGYLLYPYRASSLKNREPCAIGTLVPEHYSLANGETEPWSMQTECLVHGDDRTTLQGSVRFLQASGTGPERTEREIILAECTLGELAKQASRSEFSFAEDESKFLQVGVELSAERATDALFKVRIRIENETPGEQADPRRVLFSTHAVLGVRGGRFLSLIDPPGDARAVAETCRNRSAWPVLIGDPAAANMILAAPIILYDYPQVAPESPGNLFDSTEIDELLTLRILTLTDAEKHALQADERTRALLERTERLGADQQLALHGAMREKHLVGAATIKSGDRVRLNPRARADILDLALAGRTATVASVEQDFEGRVLYAVTLEDDPGQDLGVAGKPGHRFFFHPEEVEPVPKPRLLIAGVGNVFHGDDAFGSEVARRLAAMPMPSHARVVDFGIRGHDLAFALQDDYNALILLDVTQRGGVPGALYVIEPDVETLPADSVEAAMDTHAMHPLRVLRMIQAAGGNLPRIWLVGCEPATFGPEEGLMGLSEPVEAAVPEAIALVQSLLARICAHE